MRQILGFLGVIFSSMLLLVIPALPIVGAFLYGEGPEWIKAGGGGAIAVSFLILGVVIALLAVPLLLKSIEAIND